MTSDNEAIVRHAYHTAEGSVLDVAGFVGGFAADGVINLGRAGLEPIWPTSATARASQSTADRALETRPRTHL